MIRTTTNFNTYNDATEKNPVWIIEFDSIADPKFCSQTFSGITSAYNKYVKNVDVLGAKVDPLNFKYTYGGFNFEIIDKSNEVTGIFASYNLMNRKVTIKYGYQELTTADFITFPNAYITDYQFDNGVYKFEARDTLYWLEKPLFQSLPETTLATGMPLSDTTEHLGETAFTTHALWYVTGDFDDTGGDAAYTHGAGSGTLIQTRDNMVREGKADIAYKFTYTVSGKSGSPVANITTAFASATTALDITNGTHTTYFKSNSNPGDFVISATSAAAEAFTLDNVSLKLDYQSVHATSTTGFTTADSATWGDVVYTYLRIDQEIVRYTALSSSRYTVTRAQLGTTESEHSKGTRVSEVYYVYTNPYKFLMQLLQTSHGGAGGTYDLTLTGWGLGAGDYTDEIQIKNDYQRYNFSTSESTDRQAWVMVKTEPNALKFITENILKVIPAYLITTEDGKIGIKFWDIRAQYEGYSDYDLDSSGDHKMTLLSNYAVSHIEMYRQFNGGTESWEDVDEITSSVFTDVYGTKKRLIIKPNIYSGLTTVFNTIIVQSVFLRYANPPVQLKFKTLQPGILEVGDVANITSANLPYFYNGTMGWTSQGCEVVANNITYDNGLEVSYAVNNHVVHERANLFTLHCYVEADIDDTDLTLDAPGSDALGANDAYIDTGLSTNNFAVCTIQATLPGGSSGEENITLELRIQHTDTTNTDMIERTIYYDPAKTGTMEWELRVNRTIAFAQAQRVKVDWTAESGGAGDKLTNVKFVRCKIVKYQVTSYTTTDLK